MKTLRVIVISIFLSSLTFFSIATAETKRNCDEISSKTLVGQWDKWRCSRGAEPRKKFSLKNLNPFKKNKD